MEGLIQIFNDFQLQNQSVNYITIKILDYYDKNKENFNNNLEQCFLKIIKNVPKIPREQLPKFEQIIIGIFALAYSRNYSGKQISCVDQHYQKFFQHFIMFFSEGLTSKQNQIQIFSCRIIFNLLKIICPKHHNSELLQNFNVNQISNLVKNCQECLNNKKLRIIGIKIANLLFKISNSSGFSKMAEPLLINLYQIICLDEDPNARKIGIINLPINAKTLNIIVKSLQDKSQKVRSTVFKSLINNKVLLSGMSLGFIYKILHDGYTSVDNELRENCLQYMIENYNKFEQINLHNSYFDKCIDLDLDNQEIQQDKSEIKYIEQALGISKDNNNKSNQASNQENLTNREAQQNSAQILSQFQQKLRTFLALFQLHKTLLYPHIYKVIEKLLKDMLRKNVFDMKALVIYMNEILQNIFKSQDLTKLSLIKADEIFFIRIVIEMWQQNTEKQCFSPELDKVIDLHLMNCQEISALIKYYHNQHKLFSLYQILLIAEQLTFFQDDLKFVLRETIQQLLVSLNEINIPINDKNDKEYNDVFYQIKLDQLINSMFAQSYYDSIIIQSSNDLIIILIRIYRILLGDESEIFSNKVSELLWQVVDPLKKQDGEEDDDETAINIPLEIKQITDNVNNKKDQIDEIENQIKKVKQMNTSGRSENEINQQVNTLQQKKQDLIKKQKIMIQRCNELEDRVFSIHLRVLMICQSVLMFGKVEDNNQAARNLLNNFIQPAIQYGNDKNKVSIEYQGIKALSLYAMLSKKFCKDYFRLFQGYITTYITEKCEVCYSSVIISLKAISDYIILHDLEKESNQQQHDFQNDDTYVNYEKIYQQFIKIAFKGNKLAQSIAVDGLCRVIMHKLENDSVNMLVILLHLWSECRATDECNQSIYTILSQFFKKYTSRNLAFMSRFEQALEMYFQFWTRQEQNEFLIKNLLENIKIQSNDQKLMEYKRMQILHCLKLLSFNFHQLIGTYSINQIQEFVTPQEEFFSYLCQKASDGHEEINLLLIASINQNIFDFHGYAPLQRLRIMLEQFNNFYQTVSKDKRNLLKFKNYLNRQIKQLESGSKERLVVKEETEEEQQKLDDEILNNQSQFSNNQN